MALISSFFRIPGQWRRRRLGRRRMYLQLLVLAVLFLVVLPLYIIYKPPALAIEALSRRYPEVIFRVNTAKRMVALTIDDAPSEYTREILEVLKSNQASATFFTIGGQVAGREDIFIDILRSGSELGNHAMHDEASLSLPSSVLRAEIDKVNNLIERAYDVVDQNRIGYYFRPGSGVFNERILQVAKEAGYRTVLGSIYPHDPFVKLWWLNAWNILSSVRPGAIIICHDRRGWTVPMLKRVVPALKRQGYEVVSVSELLLAGARAAS